MESITPKLVIPPQEGFSPVPIEALDHSIVERFEHVVRLYADRTAISGPGETLTYFDLNQASNQIANSILSTDPDENLPIPFLLQPGIKAITTLLGILKTGRPYIILNNNSPVELLNLVLSDSGAKLLVSDHANHAVTDSILLEHTGLKIFNLDEIDSSTNDQNPGIPISTNAPVAILYTSGSTGRPKGIIFGNLFLLQQATILINEWGLSPEDRIPLLNTISFGAALGTIFGALLSGAQLSILDILSANPRDLIAWFDQEKITIFRSTPAAFRGIFEQIPAGQVLDHLRILQVAGESATKHDVELFRKHTKSAAILAHHLSSTEVGYLTRYWVDHEMPIDQEILPVGYPIPGKEILLMDEEGDIVDEGETGEIVIRSRYLSSGYWNNPELTEEKFLVDPDDPEVRILHTSDLGRIGKDGALEFLGRKDDMVKVRGFRVETAEVQACLQKHPAVKEAVVVGRAGPQAGGTKKLVAYIVLHSKQEQNITELRLFLGEQIPSYMIPSYFIFMDAFPLNRNQKIDVSALPVPDGKRPHLSNPYIDPQNELEKRLQAIWQDILAVVPIGATDDFFDLGGDSLSAMKLFLEIEEVFNRKFPLSILVEASNIRQQVSILLEENFSPNWSPVVPVQPNGNEPPIFCIAGKGGNPLRFRAFSELVGENNPVYYLQSRGLEGKARPLRRVKDIAADFINEIQKEFPTGPYHFFGSSFGGLVAYEMAHQLTKSGQAVGIVAMLDTYGPGYPTFNTGIRQLLINPGVKFKVLRKHITTLLTADKQSLKEYFRYYRDFIPMEISRQREMFWVWQGETKNVELTDELKKVEKANLAAAHRYSPPEYGGDVILYKAKHQLPGVIPDPYLGWGKVKIGNLVIQEINAYHGNMLFHPAIGEIYKHLQSFLGDV